MKIRLAREDEHDLLSGLHYRAFLALTIETWGDERDEDAMVARFAADWARQIPEVVTDSDGAIVAYFRVEQRADHLWLDVMAVDPEHQRQGLGGRILAILIDRASEKMLPLRLSVYAHNKALRLYQRMGFVEYKRVGFRVKMER